MDQTAAASNPDERPIRPSASSWEERPIRPAAASASWEEQPIRPAENCASSTAAPPAENTNPHTAVLRPDDRYTIAALNYNGARVPFSPFSEEVDGKLGSVYTAVTETLVARGDWRRLPAVRNRETDELKLPSSFSMLLGTAQGKGIKWGRLGYGIWPPPLVNYTRGFEMLTRKAKLVATLAQAEAEAGGALPPAMPDALTGEGALRGAKPWELAPPSFVFHPSKPAEDNPHEALRAAVAAADAASADGGGGGGGRSAWIVKPSDGSKGDRILIVQSADEVEAHIAAQREVHEAGEAASSWVVQRYAAQFCRAIRQFGAIL